MTATLHKSDTKNFSRSLRLLDKDVYADIKRLDETFAACKLSSSLHRVKETMMTFQDEGCQARSLLICQLVKIMALRSIA